jgi:hypothetical protein
MTTLTASRVMRARRTSICPVCRSPILVGQQIAKLGTWQHIEHVIERQRESASQETA